MDEAERIVAPLPHGGEIFMPMQETFFAFQLARLAQICARPVYWHTF
jgi:hypothetical protein